VDVVLVDALTVEEELVLLETDGTAEDDLRGARVSGANKASARELEGKGGVVVPKDSLLAAI